MVGLAYTSASTASLLLDLESVLTAVLAWLVFRENADRRIVLGMLLIVAGRALLSWQSGDATSAGWIGPLSPAGACLAWAIAWSAYGTHRGVLFYSPFVGAAISIVALGDPTNPVFWVAAVLMAAGVVELQGNGDFGDAATIGEFSRSRPQVFRDTRTTGEGAPPFGKGGRGIGQLRVGGIGRPLDQ